MKNKASSKLRVATPKIEAWCINCGQVIGLAPSQRWFHMITGNIHCDGELTAPPTEISERNQTESSDSIQLTVAEIRERQADGYEEVSRGQVPTAAILMLNDIRALLGTIDSLTGQNVDQGEKLEDDQGK